MSGVADLVMNRHQPVLLALAACLHCFRSLGVVIAINFCFAYSLKIKKDLQAPEGNDWVKSCCTSGGQNTKDQTN